MPTPVAIVPSKFLAANSRAATVWALVRAYDHPENEGRGTGRVKISLAEIASHLRRSERSAYRYIREALKAGFFYSCRPHDGQLVIKYRSLRRIAKDLELLSLGPIVEVPLEECHLERVKVRATEAATEWLQQLSYFLMRKQWGKYAASAPQAYALLNNSQSVKESGLRICEGKRLLYLAPHWRPFGVSQETIAGHLGCSERTVQRRLSDGWRADRDIEPIQKRQAALQILEDCSKAEAKAFVRSAGEDCQNRLVFLGRRLFLVGCNLYSTNASLRSQRWRKQAYTREICRYIEEQFRRTTRKYEPEISRGVATNGGLKSVTADYIESSLPPV